MSDNALKIEDNALVTTDGAPVDVDALRALRDVEVEISIEIGRKRARIADILRFGVGQTIELDKTVGAPIDIYVNGQLLGRGKAIVVNERYGVRITELFTAKDRS